MLIFLFLVVVLVVGSLYARSTPDHNTTGANVGRAKSRTIPPDDAATTSGDGGYRAIPKAATNDQEDDR